MDLHQSPPIEEEPCPQGSIGETVAAGDLSLPKLRLLVIGVAIGLKPQKQINSIFHPPSSENSGIVGVVLVGSPTFRLSSQTWKIGCTLDSMGSARQYVTGPTFASTWNGPKYLLANFW
jgi:hypothetical protein